MGGESLLDETRQDRQWGVGKNPECQKCHGSNEGYVKDKQRERIIGKRMQGIICDRVGSAQGEWLKVYE